VIVLLVRHGRAGERSEWVGDDRLRPLDKKGRRQADGLVELLSDYEIERIFSSPYLRCTRTVQPLAAARGLEVEEVDVLAEGATREDVLALLEPLDARSVVLCTHGDVVDELASEGLSKGSTDVLELDDGRLSRVVHLGRPSA
jgi:phosphohistidine phosphatase SixA